LLAADRNVRFAWIKLSDVLVKGTTCTRFKYLFEMSLLRMTGGLVFLISPPTEGSKFIHQTSPRFIAYVSDGCFRQVKSFNLSRFVECHCAIARIEVTFPRGLIVQYCDQRPACPGQMNRL
jgi:hypothetical protein